jgi:hypothetical protein
MQYINEAKRLQQLAGIITENQINLIKRRLNSGKDDSELDDLVEYIIDNSPKLSNEQNKKGYEFLMNLWKSPTGKERKNSPFGYREQSVLENFEYFELAGFYTIYGIGSIPVYNVIGKSSNTSFSGSFKYYYDGKVNIIGEDGGMFANGGGVEERYILKDVEEDETTEFSAEELKEYIADWNNSMETDYEDWKDFNKGEEYYKITPISKHAKGGETMVFNYLYIRKVPNGLKLELTDEGIIAYTEEEISEMYDLFEDVQGNSEMSYIDNAGDMGFGLTEAPIITDGYYYDDNGDFLNNVIKSVKKVLHN